MTAAVLFFALLQGRVFGRARLPTPNGSIGSVRAELPTILFGVLTYATWSQRLVVDKHAAPAYPNAMKIFGLLLLMAAMLSCAAQVDQQDVRPSQLKALLDLPLEQAVQKRNA